MQQTLRYLLSLLVLFPSFGIADSANPKSLVPVVFAHGIFMNGDTIEKWKELKDYFARRGYKLMGATTYLSGTYENRAAKLNAEIERLVPEGPFHIIGHSGGGLDARLGIQRYGWGDRLLSLTTISSPHRGSAVADYAVYLVDKYTHDNPVTDFFFWVFRREIEIVRVMNTKNMVEFNATVTDDPRVKYFSLGGYAKPPLPTNVLIPLLWWGHKINTDHGFPENDGLVAPSSARWGTYLGTFESDHASIFLKVKYQGKMIYQKTYDTILDNLDVNFSK